MKSAADHLVLSFPFHAVSVQPRPDGTLVLTLRDGQATFSQVIPADAAMCEDRIKNVIREIHRDLKIASGELRGSGPESRWVWSALPTYESGPIHVTRAKRLAQRPLSQLGPRRLNAYLSA